MAHGLELFRERFAKHHKSYVLIGGMACKIADDDFRATKDLDIVLIAEELNEEFTADLWDFIIEAGYQHLNKGTGEPQFYRFDKPTSLDYPYMLELFSREPDLLTIPEGITLTPIPLEDPVSSLSAILLDNDAYRFIREGQTVLDGLSILPATHIIPLKAQAFIDLSQRKQESPDSVDSKQIKKHKNDIFRLLSSLTGEERITLPKLLDEAFGEFLTQMEQAVIPKDILKPSGLNQAEAVSILKTIYL